MADSAPAPDWASVARRLKESGVFEELWLLEDGLNLVGQKGLTGNFDRVENALADVVIYQDTIDSEAYRTYTLQTKLILEGSQVRVQGDLDGAEFRYQQAIELASDSRWACIAAYELGNVKYENRRDYDAARQYYSRCLTEYPHKYLNALQLQQVKGRLEALEMYQDIDDYRPLRMYLSASALEPAAARVEPFLELIDAYPETSLAQKAVLVLAKLSTSEETFSEIPWQNIYGHFSEYLLRAPNGPLSAHCRLAMAEMLSLRLHNYSEARLEYDKVLHMTKDPELVGRAGTQIQRLEILESGQGE
jgi:tetratricopeptide (TPR) repeat protein